MVEERSRETGAPLSKTEQFQALADRLASQYGEAGTRTPGHSLAHDLDAYEKWLDEAHRFFRDATRQELSLTYASEWLLDNDYIVRQALRQITKDLPPSYYSELPKLTQGPLKGFPRIYAVTCALLAAQNMLLNITDAQSILSLIQEKVPLTMGELWAVPTFMRYGLIEALAHALARLIQPKTPPNIPTSGPALAPIDTTPAQPAARPAPPVSGGTSAGTVVANAILSLRAISEQDWNEFFEQTSRVEATLRQDPAGIYPRMDFKTRDLYRKAVERLAFTAEVEENRAAAAALELADEHLPNSPAAGAPAPASGLEQPVETHVGYYLLSKGQPALEARLGYQPHGWAVLQRGLKANIQGVYLSGVIALALLFIMLISLAVLHDRPFDWTWVVVPLLLTIPSLTVSTSLINWAVTVIFHPNSLPKMAFRDSVPEPFRTLVVIPALIGSQEDVDTLVHEMELHALRNPEPGLLFALLTDFPDADVEQRPKDNQLTDYAIQAVTALNAKYTHLNGNAQSGTEPFYFLHRPRRWNPNEGKWMGWERKRGKLHELNRLLRGKDEGSFSATAGNLEQLRGVRFVITLDADTVLPRGAARRLAGTLAHPLNRPVFDDRVRRVTAGYTILQPRMEISPTSANQTWFTRIFAGDAGLDLYTLAVSDAYQDLFGEGSYVGKGIYDVDAFERSTAGCIPENALLSHDLLEGLLGRAGLVTDVTMIEDYPPHYFVQALRQHRWIRGDWQLLPWLLNPSHKGVNFSIIDRWKMIDNLRRSLLAPFLVLLFILGLAVLPGPALLWTVVVLTALAIPLLTGLTHSALETLGGAQLAVAFRPSILDVLRWGLAVAFLPYEAYLDVDAILTTLYRMTISHRHLLEWTTAAHTARLFREKSGTWKRMFVASLLALGVAAWVVANNPPALLQGAPVLLLWVLSPFIVHRIDKPLTTADRTVSAEQEALLRRVARQTWSFFERFVGPEDHWLPPDHFQEAPVGMVAHRTSPTNIGLLLNSTLAAYDMGYLDALALATRLSATMDTLDQLERYRGHFLNWYDTLTLQPLTPRYVSTVDSGNLTASLIITAQACRAMDQAPIFRWELWQGYLDTLDMLDQVLIGLPKTPAGRRQDTLPLKPVSTTGAENRAGAQVGAGVDVATRPVDPMRQVAAIEAELAKMRAEILTAREQPESWYALFQHASGPFWQDISRRLLEIITGGRTVFDLQALRGLQEIAAQVERQHMSVQRTISRLVPWVPLLENVPAYLQAADFEKQMRELRAALPYSPMLGNTRVLAAASRMIIQSLREAVEPASPKPAVAEEKTVSAETTSDTTQTAAAEISAKTAVDDAVKDTDKAEAEALHWLEQLEQAVDQGLAGVGALLNGYAQIAARSAQYINEMDFRFLYHPQRRIFHIGYNMDAGQLDNNYYDLLASEARIASLIAIARDEVPQSHWLQLSRPVTSVEGLRVLLSWSATMFEYLMPPLFLPAYPHTLLSDSSRGAVLDQIRYGKSKGVPWGISESGFYRFDANQSYQYRAFGVPELGFKRGLGDDLVIAPYASLMAIGYSTQAVIHNISDLQAHQAQGLWGFYEAIDFTTDRLLLGQKYAVVKEYMSHHQGMILLALVNFLHEDIMIRRMHSDPRIQSAELLLQEQAPLSAPLQSPTSAEVRGVQHLTNAPVEITPWTVPVQTPIPQVHLLSNGSYNVLITNAGSGYSSWRDTDLTRWQPDSVLDPWGTWVYLQDLEMEPAGMGLWSAGYQPVPGDANDTTVTFFPHMVVFHRREHNIATTLEVTVSADDPVEIRRVHLTNSEDHPRGLRLTSYGEVILSTEATDARHPAFNRLFIESEWVPEQNLQVFKRRPRSDSDAPLYLGHMLLYNSERNRLNGRANGNGRSTHPAIPAEHEADRAMFIGRDRTLRSPLGLERGLSGSTGATLDPIFALGQEVHLGPHESATIAYLTFAAESREEIVALAERYTDWGQIERSFHQADLAAQASLGQHNLDTSGLRSTLEVLSGLVFPFKALRAPAEKLVQNHLGQPGLWRFGVSGDYPILLVELDDPTQLDLVREVLQVHRYLRSRRFLADVVILNRQQTDYGAELNGMLYRLVSRTNSEQWLNQRGGIFILYADQMQPDERTLLVTSARVLLSGEKGSLAAQLPGYSIQVPHLPEFIASRPGTAVPVTGGARMFGDEPEPAQNQTGAENPADAFFNGFGQFSADGREYEIILPPGKPTPAPWVNVIGYTEFGFMVSEAGSQCTWAVNSGENRLTPWSNDPVRDPSGEALFLRDEETGEIWTPTPLPTGAEMPYRIRHGAGYSIFEHESHNLRQRLTLYASPDDPVKVISLRVENTGPQPRRITATQYIEWVLGTLHSTSQPYIIPEYDSGRECLLAINPYNSEFAARTAFLAASKSVHGVTADRTEFFGRNGNPSQPMALRRIGLETRLTAGEDPCAVLQLHLDLPVNGAEEIYFLLGQGADKAQALALVDKYHDAAQVEQAWQRTGEFWDHLLDAIKVHTPQAATNHILNRWLLYQALSCRIWGRTAFYQSSGAFGFRDQLQDVLALLPIEPSITRAQILNAAGHQFEAGDVLHWWHPPSGRGVRTRFSDDLLWLPYVTALYLEATGDWAILDEKITFLNAPPLKAGEDERYGEYNHSEETFSLFEHCKRAIEKGATRGPHNLPLIGTGDWNDGLNRVGMEGKGESVWLAWFLYDVLMRFAGVCEQRKDEQTAQSYRASAKDYAAAVEQSAWDGQWYRRAYYDDGTPLGSSSDPECKIDGIAQSWAVISEGGQVEHSRQAMQSALKLLVRPNDRLALLFTPPFDQTPRDPGYIKGYLPGTRENGGQYTHAATWLAWAYACLGDGKQAGALFDLLNPVLQSDSAEKAAVYRVEPYVICADIYSVDPYVRRGGWTWYTGSAAWMYRLGLEALLGFQKAGDQLRIDPVIPPEWDGFEIEYRFGKTLYRISVHNPEHTPRGVAEVRLDGQPSSDNCFALSDDGKEHQVEVQMKAQRS